MVSVQLSFRKLVVVIFGTTVRILTINSVIIGIKCEDVPILRITRYRVRLLGPTGLGLLSVCMWIIDWSVRHNLLEVS